MHHLIKSIESEYNVSDNRIHIIITDVDNNKQNISVHVTKSGTFRFSYVHPENSEKYNYKGIFKSKSKFMIYPIIGIGVISNEFLTCKLIE